MDLGFGAYQTIEQAQVLSPRMLQSLTVLQMPSAELYDYLVKNIEENPVIAFDSLDIAEKSRRHGQGKADRNLDLGEMPERAVYDNTPLVSLRLQLAMLKPEPAVEHCCLQLIGMLNENGYLDREDINLHAEMGSIPTSVLNQAIRLLQSLEPAGVGAFTVRECILLQLERKGLTGSDAFVVARDYLELLGKNQLPQIAKKSGIPLHRIVNAKELIRTLNPRPLVQEQKHADVDYVTPDIRILKADKSFTVELNQLSADNIVIDDTYSKIYRETDNETVRSFLDDHLKKAHWLRESLRQRCDTLMDCAGALLNHQRSFFEYGPAGLKPYTRREMAEEIGRSESTVSRAFKNKYVECDWGMFPAEYFFPKQPAPEQPTVTRSDIELAIQVIIENEDTSRPLSDTSIVDALRRMNYPVSRRTVAKYRDELGIPSSSMRKSFE